MAASPDDLFERIFGATIYFGTDSLAGTAKLVQRSRFNFMSEAQICRTRSAEQRVLSSEFENVNVLTEDFYRKVIEHPVPNDLDSLKVLASSPAVLDLYLWLSYRCIKAKGPEFNIDLWSVQARSSAWVCRVFEAATLSGHARAVVRGDPGYVACVPGAHKIRWRTYADRPCIGDCLCPK